MLVIIDYFTKWVEADDFVNIWDVNVKKFVCKNIITRFGVSRALILDIGLQFDSKTFWEFYSNLGIIDRYSSPTYP